MIEPTQTQNDDRTGGILGFPLSTTELTSLRKGGFIIDGQTTLVAGVITVVDVRIKDSSVGLAVYKTSGGTMGSTLRAVCTAGVLTISSMKITGTVPGGVGSQPITVTGTEANTADTSVVNYLIIL